MKPNVVLSWMDAARNGSIILLTLLQCLYIVICEKSFAGGLPFI